VRFLNRQSGAGTRLLLDWMLRENGIAARSIAGYGDVELTHSAVAAMIASGHADAGLGVEAAARQFDLGFVPLLKEDYFLVTRRELLRQPALESLLDPAEGKRLPPRRARPARLRSGRQRHGNAVLQGLTFIGRAAPCRCR
jgi:molybdate-binding protein